MALTIDRTANSVFGNKKIAIATVTFDSSYPTGGEDLNPSDLGLAFIDTVVTDGAMGYGVRFNKATGKLMAYGSTAGTEVTNATNLSTLVVNVVAIGA